MTIHQYKCAHCGKEVQSEGEEIECYWWVPGGPLYCSTECADAGFANERDPEDIRRDHVLERDVYLRDKQSYERRVQMALNRQRQDALREAAYRLDLGWSGEQIHEILGIDIKIIEDVKKTLDARKRKKEDDKKIKAQESFIRASEDYEKVESLIHMVVCEGDTYKEAGKALGFHPNRVKFIVGAHRRSCIRAAFFNSFKDGGKASLDLKTKLIDIGDMLSTRTNNGLKNMGLKTIEHICLLSEAEMLRMPNFGRKSLNELKDFLASGGLSLR